MNNAWTQINIPAFVYYDLIHMLSKRKVNYLKLQFNKILILVINKTTNFNKIGISENLPYFECSSRSFDNICSLTLFAFFDSFLRIAEHTKPVTTIK